MADQMQPMAFEDIDPQVFGMFFHWIYYKRCIEGEIRAQVVQKKSFDILKFGELWVLARRFLMPALQDHVTDTIKDITLCGSYTFTNFAAFIILASKVNVETIRLQI